MPDPDREIYPNAPLKLVAFEIQYAPIPSLEKDHWEVVYDALREDFPILGPRPQLDVEVSSSGAKELPRGRRLLNRERTNSANLFNSRTSLETSRYTCFENWQSLIERVVRTLSETVQIPSVQRLGLRYIDEIAVDGFEPEKVDDWSQYISDHLTSPALGSPFPVDEFRAGMQLNIGEGQIVNVRYGAISEPVVNPDGPLRITDSPTGPHFLIDLDSIWDAPESEYPEFGLERVMAKLEELHRPIRRIFEGSITDGLRQHMREASNGS